MLSDSVDKEFFNSQGYVAGLSVLDSEELNLTCERFEKLMERDDKVLQKKGWHMKEEWVYRLASHSKILSHVEEIIGPNIMLWGSRIFCKFPGSSTHVAWHQDGSAWPLAPAKTLTVWLALDDSTEENGALQVLPSSHTRGKLKHGVGLDDGNALDKGLFVEERQIVPEDAKTLELKAGQISIHGVRLVHGSKINSSQSRRCGIAFRYCPPEVSVVDPQRWKDFKVTVLRGDNTNQKNTEFIVPWGRI